MTDFQPFAIGTIRNKLKHRRNGQIYPVYNRIGIQFPMRLNAMALDPSLISLDTHGRYCAGEIVFSIKLYKQVFARLHETDSFYYEGKKERNGLVQHAAILMKDALCLKENLEVCVKGLDIPHAGLGSSSATIASTMTAINEMCANPVLPFDLVQYAAQNHGEEISDDDSLLMPVQCLGGSAASGHYKGGLLVIAGSNRVIGTMHIPSTYKVVIGIPQDVHKVDSRKAMTDEIANMDGFVRCGKKYGPAIAYSLVHKVFPAMTEGNLKEIGDFIFDYRYNMGSIANCAFMYPNLIKLARTLAFIKEEGHADVLSISSVGPGFFAVTKEPDYCLKEFEKAGLEVILTDIENEQYSVTSQEPQANKYWAKEAKHYATKPACPTIKREAGLVTDATNKIAIDIGCGGGRNITTLLELGFHTIAVDLSDEMLRTVQERFGKKVRTVKSDLVKLPFQDSYADLLVYSGTFHQTKSIDDFKKSLQEAARVLKYKGRVITNLFVRHKQSDFMQTDRTTFVTREGLFMTLVDPEEFFDIAREAGLEEIAGSTAQEVKTINTGERKILRTTLEKVIEAAT